MAVAEMGVEIRWRSEQGHHTHDNRDCCGVGLSDDAVLAIVLDGSSNGKASGAFARDVARNLIDWFVVAEVVTPETIIDRLRVIHAELSGTYRRDSASVVIALIERQGATCILHAGDCLAGLVQETSDIEWSIQPHNLANAISPVAIDELARSPSRNLLTRSFRTKRFMVPQETVQTFRAGQRLVLTTDGFWASLDPEHMTAFLRGDAFQPSKDRDDCSALTLTVVEDQPDEVIEAAGNNFYVVDARH